MTVTVHKTNTDPIVFEEVVKVEVGALGVVVWRTLRDDNGEWEARCMVKRHVLTAVHIDMADGGQSGSSGVGPTMDGPTPPG